MSGWERLFVDYNQYNVYTVPGASRLDIYWLGDDLLHVGGPSLLTGFCGEHTGWIQARVRVLPAPATRVDDGWDAVSEATLWCPSGRLFITGLLGGSTDALTDLAVPRGLIRVRLHARNRIHESVRTDGDPPEQHEIHAWAVSAETSWRTVLADPNARAWQQQPTKAAEWAMLSLVPRPSERPDILPPLPIDPFDDDTGLSRVTVVRHLPAPVELPTGVLPAGDLQVRLERLDGQTVTWSWERANEPIFPKPLTMLPDEQPSTVRLTSGPDGFTLWHEGVRGRHAAALGMLWDHLLDAPGSFPWMDTLRAQAAEATKLAEKYRRLQAERDAETWGGPPPPEHLRRTYCRAQQLARIDRPLLDRIDALPAARQREVARWAARRALRVAGLEQIGWIAEAITAADADRPLPPPFTDHSAAFQRLMSDPEVPHTTVALDTDPNTIGVPPGGINILQQSVAFAALTALANGNPLASALQ